MTSCTQNFVWYLSWLTAVATWRKGAQASCFTVCHPYAQDVTEMVADIWCRAPGKIFNFTICRMNIDFAHFLRVCWRWPSFVLMDRPWASPLKLQSRASVFKLPHYNVRPCGSYKSRVTCGVFIGKNDNIAIFTGLLVQLNSNNFESFESLQATCLTGLKCEVCICQACISFTEADNSYIAKKPERHCRFSKCLSMTISLEKCYACCCHLHYQCSEGGDHRLGDPHRQKFGRYVSCPVLMVVLPMTDWLLGSCFMKFTFPINNCIILILLTATPCENLASKIHYHNYSY